MIITLVDNESAVVTRPIAIARSHNARWENAIPTPGLDALHNELGDDALYKATLAMRADLAGSDDAVREFARADATLSAIVDHESVESLRDKLHRAWTKNAIDFAVSQIDFGSRGESAYETERLRSKLHNSLNLFFMGMISNTIVRNWKVVKNGGEELPVMRALVLIGSRAAISLLDNEQKRAALQSKIQQDSVTRMNLAHKQAQDYRDNRPSRAARPKNMRVDAESDDDASSSASSDESERKDDPEFSMDGLPVDDEDEEYEESGSDGDEETQLSMSTPIQGLNRKHKKSMTSRATSDTLPDDDDIKLGVRNQPTSRAGRLKKAKMKTATFVHVDVDGVHHDAIKLDVRMYDVKMQYGVIGSDQSRVVGFRAQYTDDAGIMQNFEVPILSISSTKHLPDDILDAVDGLQAIMMSDDDNVELPELDDDTDATLVDGDSDDVSALDLADLANLKDDELVESLDLPIDPETDIMYRILESRASMSQPFTHGFMDVTSDQNPNASVLYVNDGATFRVNSKNSMTMALTPRITELIREDGVRVPIPQTYRKGRDKPLKSQVVATTPSVSKSVSVDVTATDSPQLVRATGAAFATPPTMPAVGVSTPASNPSEASAAKQPNTTSRRKRPADGDPGASSESKQRNTGAKRATTERDDSASIQPLVTATESYSFPCRIVVSDLIPLQPHLAAMCRYNLFNADLQSKIKMDPPLPSPPASEEDLGSVRVYRNKNEGAVDKGQYYIAFVAKVKGFVNGTKIFRHGIYTDPYTANHVANWLHMQTHAIKTLKNSGRSFIEDLMPAALTYADVGKMITSMPSSDEVQVGTEVRGVIWGSIAPRVEASGVVVRVASFKPYYAYDALLNSGGRFTNPFSMSASILDADEFKRVIDAFLERANQFLTLPKKARQEVPATKTSVKKAAAARPPPPPPPLPTPSAGSDVGMAQVDDLQSILSAPLDDLSPSSNDMGGDAMTLIASEFPTLPSLPSDAGVAAAPAMTTTGDSDVPADSADAFADNVLSFSDDDEPSRMSMQEYLASKPDLQEYVDYELIDDNDVVKHARSNNITIV